MTRSFISSEMLAVIENAREIVDWETPSVRATSSAVTCVPAFVMGRLAIVLFISGEGPPENAEPGIYTIESDVVRCSKLLQNGLHTHAI
jgi:hypothetical protein